MTSLVYKMEYGLFMFTLIFLLGNSVLNAQQVARDACQKSPCKNGATCHVDSKQEFVCACTLHFRGKFCQDAMQTCAVLGCGSVKDCVATPRGSVCICKGDVTGRMCLLDAVVPSEWEQLRQVLTDKTLHQGELFAGLTMGVLVATMILMCVHCKKVNKRRKQLRGKYQEALDAGHVPTVPVPDWLDISSALLCCKDGTTLSDNYLPLERKPSRKPSKRESQMQNELDRLINSKTSVIQEKAASRKSSRASKRQSANILNENVSAKKSWSQMQYECRHPVKRIRMSAHALPRVKTNQLGRNAASRILNDENRQRPVRSRASVGECSSELMRERSHTVEKHRKYDLSQLKTSRLHEDIPLESIDNAKQHQTCFYPLYYRESCNERSNLRQTQCNINAMGVNYGNIGTTSYRVERLQSQPEWTENHNENRMPHIDTLKHTGMKRVTNLKTYSYVKKIQDLKESLTRKRRHRKNRLSNLMKMSSTSSSDEKLDTPLVRRPTLKARGSLSLHNTNVNMHNDLSEPPVRQHLYGEDTYDQKSDRWLNNIDIANKSSDADSIDDTHTAQVEGVTHVLSDYAYGSGMCISKIEYQNWLCHQDSNNTSNDNVNSENDFKSEHESKGTGRTRNVNIGGSFCSSTADNGDDGRGDSNQTVDAAAHLNRSFIDEKEQRSEMATAEDIDDENGDGVHADSDDKAAVDTGLSIPRESSYIRLYEQDGQQICYVKGSGENEHSF